MSNRTRSVVSALVVAFALAASAGCKNQPAAAGGGSAAPAAPARVAHCDLQTASECTEYNAMALAGGEDTWHALCTGSSGTWAAGACPAAGVVGSCTVDSRTIRSYSTGGNAQTAAQAQQSCTSFHQGTFRAGM